MSRWEYPSFSSSLLDKIYRSIDEDERGREDVKFYETKAMPKRHSKSGRDAAAEEEMAALRRACLIEKWIEKKASKKVEAQRRQSRAEVWRHSRKVDRDHDDGVFFSSNSCSSESSSGGFSSSDAESMYVSRPPRSSCFFPPLWPKPIRTSVQARPVKTEERKNEKKQSALLNQQREFCMLGDYCHIRRVSDQKTKAEESTIKSKSRALKVYDNLKKVKQPISPGGRVANFINSLFTAGQVKKIRRTSSVSGYEETDRKIYSVQDGSTCSSASSFSRSCLSKNSPNTRERLRNGVKKSVQFYPESIVVGEDRRPSVQKCVYEEQDAHLMPVTLPTAWKIGRSQSRKTEEIVKLRVLEKSRQAEEAAKEFSKDHHRNQSKNELLFNRDYDNHDGDGDDDDIDDDAASCSSSELFELDHLALVGKERYLEELPVYETTRVNRTNRAMF